MTLTAFLLLTLKLCVPALVFAVGLGTTAADLLALWHRRWLLMRSRRVCTLQRSMRHISA